MTEEERKYVQLRLKLADYEFETQRAQRELACFGEWRTDHDAQRAEIRRDIGVLLETLSREQDPL